MRRSTQRWLTVALLFVTAAYAIAEEVTLTTYYPSPRGVYEELRWGQAGQGGVLQKDQGASIELKGAAGQTPYIDFSNDPGDFDMRLRLTSNDTLEIEGGSVSIGSLPSGFSFNTLTISDTTGSGIPTVALTTPGTGSSFLTLFTQDVNGDGQATVLDKAWIIQAVADHGSSPVELGHPNDLLIHGGVLSGSPPTTPVALMIDYETGNVGVGTESPTTPAPNGRPSNLDVNDVYLRSTNQWLSASAGGGFWADNGTGTDSIYNKNTGQVNIGAQTSISPQSKLYVNGKLLVNGAVAALGGYWQPGTGGERLRMVRGAILANGAPWPGIGSGYTPQRTALGQYNITFATAFASAPAVAISGHYNAGDPGCIVRLQASLPSGFFVEAHRPAGAACDSDWDFIAVSVPQ